MSARLQRVAVLATVWASLELLERIAYRAGVTDAAAAADSALADLEKGLDDFVDASDVIAEHFPECCAGAHAA